MGVEIDDVALEFGVLDGQFRPRRLFAILKNSCFNELASSTLTVVLCIENEVDVLIH